MVVIRLIEVVLGIIFLLVIGTQIVIPLIYNRKPFPWFRAAEKLEKDISDADEVAEAQRLQDELKQRKGDDPGNPAS